jgi:glucose/mannose-6-phosphate isomerase
MSDALATLDNPASVTRRDPKGMYALAMGFPDQCRTARRIAEEAGLPRDGQGIRQVVLTGLGGSAAGGDFVRALFDAEAKVPFSVNRDYALPAWVGANTLVFATSYSGNTEETLSAYADARRRGARIIAVTSGGELRRLAEQDGVPAVVIPGGQPPRTAMGFMLVPVLAAASRLGLLQEQDIAGAAAHMEQALAGWRAESPSSANEAKRLAATLHGALGVLYGLGGWQTVVATRWKGQINENAKQHIFAHALPEMNHNEILGWEGAGRVGVARWVTLLLEDGAESDRMKLRAEVTLELVRKGSAVERVRASGPTLLAKMLSLALLGDFVSLYLAALNGEDPYAIRSIDLIKERLSVKEEGKKKVRSKK